MSKQDPKENARRKMRALGRQGGLQTVARHGVEHMRRIGRKGAAAFHSRYSIAPVGTSQYAVVRRGTNVVVAFLDGLPFRA